MRFATVTLLVAAEHVQAWRGEKEMPDVQEAEIQADEEATKERNRSADIMKESRRTRKREASRSSLVKMSLGLISPGMCRRSISREMMLSRTAQSRRLM